MTTRIINLFAGPGAGKSTTAAGVFYELKLQGFNVEMPREFAKDMVWAGRQGEMDDQLYIFGQQHHRIWSLVGKVDAIVCDCPLIISSMYGGDRYTRDFHRTVLQAHHQYDNSNYFIERVKEYEPRGRNQTEAEAREVDNLARETLCDYGIQYTEVKGNREGVDQIVERESRVLLDRLYPQQDQ